MSRIGIQPIDIPDKTEVSVKDGVVFVKGPHGELSRSFPREISITVENGAVVVKPTKKTQAVKALWGTWASHVMNMLEGVTKKYEQKLIIEGVGYRAEVRGKKLVMQLGFSHPVEVAIPEGIEVSVEKESIVVSGIDKEKVGHFVAVVRARKKPEPYKGKGIRREGEIIRRKQGKKAISAGSA